MSRAIAKEYDVVIVDPWTSADATDRVSLSP